MGRSDYYEVGGVLILGHTLGIVEGEVGRPIFMSKTPKKKKRRVSQ